MCLHSETPAASVRSPNTSGLAFKTSNLRCKVRSRWSDMLTPRVPGTMWSHSLLGVHGEVASHLEGVLLSDQQHRLITGEHSFPHVSMISKRICSKLPRERTEAVRKPLTQHSWRTFLWLFRCLASETRSPPESLLHTDTQGLVRSFLFQPHRLLSIELFTHHLVPEEYFLCGYNIELTALCVWSRLLILEVSRFPKSSIRCDSRF